MQHEPRPAIHMEKLLLSAWVGPYVQWGRASGNLHEGQTVLARLMGSDVAPACGLCGPVGRRLRKGTMVSVHLSVWENVGSQFSP